MRWSIRVENVMAGERERAEISSIKRKRSFMVPYQFRFTLFPAQGASDTFSSFRRESDRRFNIFSVRGVNLHCFS
jgi:hypothetical protein